MLRIVRATTPLMHVAIASQRSQLVPSYPLRDPSRSDNCILSEMINARREEHRFPPS
ncbi:hypothetical protein BVI434_430005 [Burkholderia vietnamiensis]|nr:hypothetical protein BVI434_430005 [Burkholderia vietnamiensis]